ncbi:hypothetical protein [Fusibacter sp. 3D3]|uniref:hypothetical protein n=1 Tax=Fusibacter sp. 3D3 TaxID=1048380 RepID=UPI000852A73F|nr:hypothetical protein [Fusibacter sp. 3D3]GAU79690.1 hypothetical protein F3D3_4354 [Fusibacter sp. 3D3]
MDGTVGEADWWYKAVCDEKTGPDSFDYFGFLGYVYRSVYDKDLGHSSSGMSKVGVAVEKNRTLVPLTHLGYNLKAEILNKQLIKYKIEGIIKIRKSADVII